MSVLSVSKDGSRGFEGFLEASQILAIRYGIKQLVGNEYN